MPDDPTPTDASPGGAYRDVSSIPNRVAIEHQVLDRWTTTKVFHERRDRNRGGEPFSFLDGPITANNPMGVHHAWGRTLKDIIQRYQAMEGRDLRWQNGFDCQGLWVEVETERALGFNSKAEIERYGLDRFAGACRDRVVAFAQTITDQSRRLGMWMDWDRSYFTMTDANISAIWTFLQECHRRGWLYEGHRLMPWCHRCGTSLSQHELTDSYTELTHPSVFLRLPLEGYDEGLAVWTTTPWTLPANVAVAVDPNARYGLVETDGRPTWVAEPRVADIPNLTGTSPPRRVVNGRDLVGLTYRPPLADLPAQREVTHRVIAWDDVSLDEGTGLVHIAPGCGAEDFALARVHGLPTLSPLEEDGRYSDGYGWLRGLHVDDTTSAILDRLADSGLLLDVTASAHRYPVCWRCSTPLVHRVVDEWFLACDEVREPMRRAARTVRWVPPQLGRRMDDWLAHMGDWCISRKRYWGLPLPFYRCPSGHVTVVGSKDELLRRAARGPDDPEPDLPELHRPWIDAVMIACDSCGQEARRVTEVGDCWLDAGIVAFSTLGWRTPDHAEWDRWFPADVVCEMHEQVRLWFYALLFMNVVLDGRTPYRNVLTHGSVNDETGREMHKSWGNAIWFDDAVEIAGADTLRWLCARQSPTRDLNFGYTLADAAARRFLTFWNSYSFFVTYATIDGFRPSLGLKDEGPTAPGLTGLDRWILARANALVRDCRAAFDAGSLNIPAATVAFDEFTDDLSNWYVRRSRDRFWQRTNDANKEAAFETLWFALVTAIRSLAPIMPFVTDHIWDDLVHIPLAHAAAPRSVHLDTYPAALDRFDDLALVDAMADVRRVAELGRAARADVGVRQRQPLAALYAVCHDTDRRRQVDEHARLIAEECNVKAVHLLEEADDVAVTEIAPDFSRLGPTHGSDAPRIAQLLRAGEVARRPGGGYQAGQWRLEDHDVVLRTRARPGYAVAEGEGWVVALDAALTPTLELEGRARDLVRDVQQRRKELGLAVTARIEVVYPPELGDVIEGFRGWIGEQTLAVALEEGRALEVRPHSRE